MAESLETPIPQGNQTPVLTRLTRFQIVSSIIPILSFFLGGAFTLWRTAQSETDLKAQRSQSEADTRTAQWQSTLQTIGLEENKIIPSAFLLQSFDNDDNRKSEARDLEYVMLMQTTSPDTFDIVFQDIVRRIKDPEALAKLMDIDWEIVSQLQVLCDTVQKNCSDLSENKKAFRDFLARPMLYFRSTQEDKERLNETLILIWKLDTFSNSMDCIWNVPGSTDCPHFSQWIGSTEGAYTLNHPIPIDPKLVGNKGFVDPKFIDQKTCHVEHAPGKDQYVCY